MPSFRTNPLCALGAGFALGALAAAVAARRSLPRTNPRFAAWQAALARAHGAVPAAMTVARARARYRTLLRERPMFNQPALMTHLVDGILPSLALYRTLLEETGDQTSALQLFDLAMREWVEVSPRSRFIRAVDWLPFPAAYAAMRLGNRAALSREFPNGDAGWTIRVVEDSDRRIAYDITACFYQKVLTAYGVPELTAHFCQLDDALFGRLRRVRFERNETLGRGNRRCDFCFSRVEPAIAQPEARAAPDMGR